VGDVRAIGAEPVLVIHAHRFQDTTSREDRQWLQAWQKFYPLVTGRELLLFDSLAALRMDAIARDSAVSLVDPRPALRASGTGTFADHTHFSDEGAEVVARAVALSVGPALQLRRARPAQPITDAPDASRPPGGAVPD
jgi:lysophospholipase L1-like esterase